MTADAMGTGVITSPPAATMADGIVVGGRA